jgi:hypothetical protein
MEPLSKRARTSHSFTSQHNMSDIEQTHSALSELSGCTTSYQNDVFEGHGYSQPSACTTSYQNNAFEGQGPSRPSTYTIPYQDIDFESQRQSRQSHSTTPYVNINYEDEGHSQEMVPYNPVDGHPTMIHQSHRRYQPRVDDDSESGKCFSFKHTARIY